LGILSLTSDVKNAIKIVAVEVPFFDEAIFVRFLTMNDLRFPIFFVEIDFLLFVGASHTAIASFAKASQKGVDEYALEPYASRRHSSKLFY
jgi:hypothetical protein